MANTYMLSALTGGATGALDSLDGDDLSDGDTAFVVTEEYLYLYRLDATSLQSESSPNVIAPDDNASTKRWLLLMNYANLQDSNLLFHAEIASAIANATGDTAKNLTGAIWTVNSEKGECFSNGTFTAPKADFYEFAGIVKFQYMNATDHVRLIIKLITDAGNLTIMDIDPRQLLYYGFLTLPWCGNLELDEDDTAYLQIHVDGAASDAVSILASTQMSCTRMS